MPFAAGGGGWLANNLVCQFFQTQLWMRKTTLYQGLEPWRLGCLGVLGGCETGLAPSLDKPNHGRW